VAPSSADRLQLCREKARHIVDAYTTLGQALIAEVTKGAKPAGAGGGQP
jgi:hypothetical protein